MKGGQLMDRSSKLSVTDSFRIAKLQALQERLEALQSLEAAAEMKTTQKLQLLRLQGKPEHARAAMLLNHEVTNRAAAIKLAKLNSKLTALSIGDKCGTKS